MADPCCRLPLTENAASQRSADAALVALLQDVLGCLRRRRDTPLQEDDDEGLPMNPATFQALVARHFSQAGPRQFGAAGLPTALDRLVDQSLEENASDLAGESFWTSHAAAEDYTPAATENGAAIEPALHAWIESLWNVLREVHPRAIEILALRRNGFDERDVSERLTLPLRLVGQIVNDVRIAWQRRRS